MTSKRRREPPRQAGSIASAVGNLLNINAFYLQIIIGALILIAVAFDQFQGRRSRSG